MEALLSAVVAVLFAVSAFLLLQGNLVRMVVAVIILGNGANLLVFVAGGLTRGTPPLLRDAPVEMMANPLPQALVLTAIVIGLGMTAFLLVLCLRAFLVFKTSESSEFELEEPPKGGPFWIP